MPQSELGFRERTSTLSSEKIKEIQSSPDFQAWEKNYDASFMQKGYDRLSQLATGLGISVNDAYQEMLDFGTKLDKQLPDHLQTKERDNIIKQKLGDMMSGIEEENVRAAQAVEQRKNIQAPQSLQVDTTPEVLTDIAAFGIPTARLGAMSGTNKLLETGGKLLSKEGAKQVGKDTLSNTLSFGAADYGISKAYGLSDEEAMMNAMMAGGVGLLGTPLAAGAKGSFKALDNIDPEQSMRQNYQEGGSMAGGGKPPEMDDMTRAEVYPDVRDTYDVTKDIRDIEDIEGQSFQQKSDRVTEIDERDIKGLDEVEVKLRELEESNPTQDIRQQYSDIKRIEEGVDFNTGVGIIKRNNLDTFKDMTDEQIRIEFENNNKFYQGMLSDTQKQLEQALDMEPKIKVGESETLYDPTYPDSTKAEAIAEIKAANKAKRIEAAKQPEKAKFDYETLKKELDAATDEFNKLQDSIDDVAVSLAEKRLTKAIRESKAYSTENPIKGTLDDMYNTGDIQPAMIDRGFVFSSMSGRKDFQDIFAHMRKAMKEKNFEKASELDMETINKIRDIKIDADVMDTATRILQGGRKVKPKEYDVKNIIVQTLLKHDGNLKIDKGKIVKIKSLDEAIAINNKKSDAKVFEWETNTADLYKQGFINAADKELFDRIIKNTGNIKVYKQKAQGANTAEYDPVSNVIKVSSRLMELSKDKIQETIMHELVHVATSKKLSSNPEALSKIQSLFENAKKNVPLNVFKNQFDETYWRSSVDEFIAEGMSNPAVIRKLENASPKNIGLFEKIKDILVGLFKKKDDSIRKQLIKIFDELQEDGIKTTKDIEEIGKIAKETDSFFSGATNLFADVLDTPTAKNFREIYNATKKAFDSATRYKNAVEGMMDKHLAKYGDKAKALNKELYEHLIKTDFVAIKEFKSLQEANAYLRDNIAIYTKYKDSINLLAKSMQDSKYMNSTEWRGNGYAIMKKYGVKPDDATIEIIEKMASIKAMSTKNWEYIRTLKNKDPELFETAMQLMSKRDELSKKLFSTNKHDRIKGYVSEVYSNIDSELSYRKGAVPPNIQNKTKGQLTNKPKNMTEDEFIQFAKDHNLGIVYKELEGVVHAAQARKVASEAVKVHKMGKVEDFSEIMGETLSTTVRKQNINSHVISKINKILEGDNGLFNGTGNDFRTLTKAERNMLPKQLVDKIGTINKDYAHQLLGNYEVGFKNAPEAVNIAQTFLKDFVAQFKEAVVLKNPTSYVNNIMFNVTIGLQNGIPIKDIWKYHKEAAHQFKQMRKLQNDLIEASIKNQDLEPIMAELKKLDIYEYTQKGLAMSVLADITSTPSYSKRVTEKGMKKLVEAIVGKGQLADDIGNVGANLYLSPSATTGKYLLELFTQIDVAGRYALTKHNIKNGMSTTDAVNKSNSVFGDLDKLNPEWVQYLSEFGAVPFASWYYRIAGGLGKNIKENLPKAIGIAAVLYGAQEVLGKRTESFNPMLTLTNSPLDMVSMSPYFNIPGTIESAAVPAAYNKVGNPEKMVISDAF